MPNRHMVFSILAALALMTGCSKDDSDPSPDPGPTGPPAMMSGDGRLWTSSPEVDPGGLVVVTIDVHTGTEVLGAASCEVSYDHDAFDLIETSSEDPVLGDAFHSEQTAPGTLYLAWTNTTPPDADATGQRCLAELTFRAKGGSGSSLGLSGRLLSLGTSAFPADDIGGGCPRDLGVPRSTAIR